MQGARASRRPLLLALAVNALVLAAVGAAGIRLADGQFVYALDDAYIHLSLSRNLALHGLLGATPYEFASATSSPGWTVLLAAAFKVFGVGIGLPLLLAGLSSFGLIALGDGVLRRVGVGERLRALALLWLVLVTPMSALVWIGMEHVTHAFVALALVWASALLLAHDTREWSGLSTGVVALGFVAGALRFESLAIVAVVTVLALLRRRWLLAVLLPVLSAASLVALGVISRANGGFLLPNSVLVKAAEAAGVGTLLADPGRYLGYLADTVIDRYPTYLLLGVSLLLVLLQRRHRGAFWRPEVLVPAIAAATAVGHSAFGDFGWFYRYEAYLVVLLSVGIVLQLHDLGTLPWRVGGRRALTVVCAALIGLALMAGAVRGGLAAWRTPQAMENLYLQQYQMAMFLRANPQFRCVAIGDLGAISFYNDGLHITDLEGLAESHVPFESLGRQRLDSTEIGDLTRADGVELAVVFPDYFDLPVRWVGVASWTVPRAVSSYKETVVFYAIPPTDPSAVAAALEGYASSRLPNAVAVETIAPLANVVPGE